MQICARCNTSAPDAARECPSCQADLTTESVAAVALKKLLDNKRVYAIHVATAEDACPACQAVQGTYTKDNVPTLPVEGCSHTHGCRCFYQPLLEEIYP
jgi:rubrerythrin